MKSSPEKKDPKDDSPKPGRPSLFTEIVAKKIVELFEEGKTDEKVAEIIGVSSQTIRNWRKGNKEFLWAVNEAKQKADEIVEASLFQRAAGYTHQAEKIHFDKDGGVHRAEYREHYPPDATSMIFWLKNRKPAEWRDRVELVHEKKGITEIDTGDGEADQFDEFTENDH